MKAAVAAALAADLDGQAVVQVLLPPCGLAVGLTHPQLLRLLPVLWSSVFVLP